MVLRTDTNYIFTVEKVNKLIILQANAVVMRLGPIAAASLHNGMQQLLKESHMPQLDIEYAGKKLFTLICDTKYFWIIGTNTRFSMQRETADKLLQWLDENVK